MKRWPVVRHCRYFWHKRRVERFAYAWYQCGIGMGYPNPSDLHWLQLIWEGKA